MTDNTNGAVGTLDLGGDFTVKRLGYGAMRLCGKGVWGEPDDPQGAEAVLRRVVEIGIDLIDTSDANGPEVNEHQISNAVHPYPENLTIATKGDFTRPGPAPDRRRSRHAKRLIFSTVQYNPGDDPLQGAA
ncbi:MAG: aldo/keto reductase [Rubrobacter sp.]|jgi:aryl-alcohol dehydrogenase-like predicted oxidoreductase|nr:aldo/keto reductase [Rubrobacter sp.]